MDFFREYIGNLRRRPIGEYPFNQVVEVKAEEYIHHILYCRGDALLVYGLPEGQGQSLFEVVIQKEFRGVQTAFSLCRFRERQEAEIAFKSLSSVLQPLSTSLSTLITGDTLQEVCNHMRENPHQQLAHLAAAFSFNDCFKPLPSPTSPGQTCKPLVNDVNIVDSDSLVTPLHLAVKSNRLATVQAVLSLNPKFDLCDKNGNNCLHYAASTSRETIAAICSAIIAANNNIPNGNGDQGDGNVINTASTNGNSGLTHSLGVPGGQAGLC